MALEKLIANLKALKSDLERTLDNNIQDHLTDFADMERERLNKGIGNDGQLLKRRNGRDYPYSPQYSQYKRAHGGQVQVVDLKFTGKYQSGITASHNGLNRVGMYSRDQKDEYLSRQYPKAHGFSPEQRQDIKEFFIPEIVKTARTKITNR